MTLVDTVEPAIVLTDAVSLAGSPSTVALSMMELSTHALHARSQVVSSLVPLCANPGCDSWSRFQNFWNLDIECTCMCDLSSCTNMQGLLPVQAGSYGAWDQRHKHVAPHLLVTRASATMSFLQHRKQLPSGKAVVLYVQPRGTTSKHTAFQLAPRMLA